MPRKPREEIIKIPIGADMPDGRFTFFKIPDWLFIHQGIGWGAKLVYAVVLRFAGTHTFPLGGLDFAQDVLHISRGEFFKRLRELEDAGFITKRLDPKYKRRIKITPIHNVVAEAFYDSEESAFDMWEKYRQTKCLQTATFPKIEQSPNGDSTTNVLSPGGDSLVSKRRHYNDQPPHCISETSTSETKNSETDATASNNSLLSDQNQTSKPNTLQVTEETPETETPPQSPSPHGEVNNFETQSTSYDLQLDTEVCKFVKNAYTQSRGSKISNAELKRWSEKIELTERSISPVEFRTGLWDFLNTSSEWLRKAKWPIAAFLKDPTNYSAPVLAYRPRHSASATPSRASVSSETPANAQSDPARITQSNTQSAIPEATKSSAYLTIVNEWNTIIPELPVGALPSYTVSAVEKAIADPDFGISFGTVVAKCKKLAAAKRTEVSFLWLFSKTKDGPMWQQVYMGKYDWLMSLKLGDAPTMTPTQRLIEKKRREKEDREKEERGVKNA